MPRCNNCSKSGLLLKIQADTGLCLDCYKRFAKSGKQLTEKIMKSKNTATVSKDPAVIADNCKNIERFGNELIQLHKQFQVEPSNELLDLIKTYKKMRVPAGNQTR